MDTENKEVEIKKEVENNVSEQEVVQEAIRMDKKSKILLAIFVVLIAISTIITYYKIMIKRDYMIEAQIDCDPETESCFIYKCDPEQEECTGNPEEDTSYYKIINKNASRVSVCDSGSEECQPLVCGVDEPDCEITLCSPEDSSGDSCSSPGDSSGEKSAVLEEEASNETIDKTQF